MNTTQQATTTNTSQQSTNDITLTNDPVVDQDQLEQVHHDETPINIPAVTLPIIPHQEAQQTRDHTIKDILERPIQVGSITWSDTHAQNTKLFVFNVPGDLLGKEQFYMKADGFKHFTAKKMVLRIMLNSQPFQQGALRAAHLPIPSPDNDYNSMLDSIYQFSCLPGKTLTLGSQQDIIVEIPFVYPVSCYDLTQSTIPWAVFETRVLDELFGGDITATIHAHFEGVEIDMPISQPLARELAQEHVEKITRTYIERHMGREQKTVSGKLSATQKEAKSSGTLSGLLSMGGNIANQLSGIPGISSVASTAANILNIGSSLASAFGWSKPIADATPQQTRPIPARFINNAEGVSHAHNMALCADNANSGDQPIFGENIDEMSLKMLNSVPGYIQTNRWTTTTPARTLIGSMKLNPLELGVHRNGPDIYTINMGWLATMFELWRGGFNFTINLILTRFHAGKLCVVYFNTNTPPPDVLTDDIFKNYHKVIDCISTTCIEFSVPYIQAEPWKNVDNKDSNYSTSIGYVAIYSMTKLSAQDNVSPSVSLVTFGSLTSNFEWAIPRTPSINSKPVKPGFFKDGATGSGSIVLVNAEPRFIAKDDSSGRIIFNWLLNVGGTTTVAWPPDGDSTWKIRGTSQTPNRTEMIVTSSANGTFQCKIAGVPSEWVLPNGTVVVSLFDTNYKIKKVDIDRHIGRTECLEMEDFESIVPQSSSRSTNNVLAMTIGEQIHSLKQLCKRITYEKEVVLTQNDPYFHEVGSLEGAASNMVNYIQPAYRGWVGNFRYLLAPKETITSTSLAVTLLPNGNASTLAVPKGNSQSTVYCFPIIEGFVEIDCPYYNRNFFRVVGDKSSQTLLSPIVNYFALQNRSETDMVVTIGKSVGESFQMGIYLAPPTLIEYPGEM